MMETEKKEKEAKDSFLRAMNSNDSVINRQIFHDLSTMKLKLFAEI